MQLLIRIYSGKTIVLDVEETYTVLQVKEFIYDREMYPVYLQKLIFNRKYLDNSKTLKEYGMVHESFLHLV
jgi:ubiquitin C